MKESFASNLGFTQRPAVFCYLYYLIVCHCLTSFSGGRLVLLVGVLNRLMSFVSSYGVKFARYNSSIGYSMLFCANRCNCSATDIF